MRPAWAIRISKPRKKVERREMGEEGEGRKEEGEWREKRREG